MSRTIALARAGSEDFMGPVPPGRLRLTWRAVARRARERAPAIRRTLPRDLALLLLCYLITRLVGAAWITTDSVHASAALILKGSPPAAGELVAFAYAGDPIPNYYANTWTAKALQSVGLPATLDGPRKGDGFIKYMVGVAGDRIEVVGRDVFLQTRQGRVYVGRAKEASRHGVPLQPIRPQTIPQGFVYVWAPHVDALDSRYAAMGLVPVSSFVGRGVRLW